MASQKSIASFFKKSGEKQSETTESETDKRAAKKNKSAEEQGPAKKKSRKFNKDWVKKYPWVVCDEADDIMYCKYCREYPNLADTKSTLFKGTGSGGNFREDSLFYHQKSAKHLACLGRWNVDKNKANPLENIVAAQSKKIDEVTKKRMSALFNTSYFTAKENIAFSKFRSICELQIKNGADMGSMYHDDACRNFIDVIAGTDRSKVCDDLKNARFISILADGSTDSAVIEQESIFVRFVDGGLPKTQFVDIVPLASATADGVLAGIDKGLQSAGLDVQQVNQRIVGCNFDGASVMMGSKGGVAVKIQDRVQNRDIMIIHCVAHNLELAVLDAVKGISYLTTFQATVQQVFKFYFYSPKRRRELIEIASILEEESINQTGLQKTRWVASRFRALLALEKSLPTVVYHLNHAESTGRGEDKARAKGIVKELCSERFLRFRILRLM